MRPVLSSDCPQNAPVPRVHSLHVQARIDALLTEASVVVVGAGVVGASTALALQQDGHRVTLVDRDQPSAGASFGNAGIIVNESCVPTALPGVAMNAIRHLGNPLAPLSIRPAYFHRILPWLMRFMSESRPSRVSQNARHLHALTKTAASSWRQLTIGTELDQLLNPGGWLKVYETERSFAASNRARAVMDAVGKPYEILTAPDIQDLEPNLSPIFERGIFQKDSLSITNPERMVQGMVDLFVGRGGTFERFNVHGIGIGSDEIELRDSRTAMSARKVVIATGAWSKELARQMGNTVPLDTERGYHLMLSAGDSSLLQRPVMNGDRYFVLCPMETGLRLTGQVEFAGVDAVADYRKIRRLLPVAKRMLPAFDSTEESVWMGCRPSLPDSLPVLGFATNSNNVLFAFGHQHLGMTLGPVTGQIIADLVAGRDPGIDMAPYRPERF